MKIAIYHELPKGGARKSVNEMAKYLKKQNTVDLYTLNAKNTPDEESFFTRIYSFPFSFKKWNGGSPLTRIYKDTVEFYKLYLINKQIAKTIRDNEYDILFVHASQNIEAPFVLRFKNAKKIYFLHDPYFRLLYEPELHTHKNMAPVNSIYDSMIKKLLKKLDAQNVAGADYVFANSEFSRKGFKSAYNKNSQVVHLGVDTTFYKPNANTKKYDVLFVGSRSEIDGYDTLQEFLSLINKSINVKVLLAEDEWISSNKGMRQLYLDSKLVLCLARKEPFGLTPLEAMACGIPVVAVDEGGYSETIIHGKTGYLVKRDARELSRAVQKILTNKALQKAMEANARKHVEKEWDSIQKYKNLEDALRKTIKQ